MLQHQEVEMEEKLMLLLGSLGLMFGYPDDADARSPLDVDTDAALQSILQDLTSQGATEDTIEELFQQSIDSYTSQVNAVISAHSVGG